MCKGKQLLMKGFDGSFRNNFWGNIVLEIRDSTMEELRLEDVFRVAETREAGEYIVGRVVRGTGLWQGTVNIVEEEEAEVLIKGPH